MVMTSSSVFCSITKKLILLGVFLGIHLNYSMINNKAFLPLIKKSTQLVVLQLLRFKQGVTELEIRGLKHQKASYIFRLF